MRKFVYILILTVLFSFGWGLWWGFYTIEQKTPEYLRGPSIRVLAKSGFFTETFRNKFMVKTKVRMELKNVNSDIDLLRELLAAENKYDMVVIPSYMVKSFLVENRLMEIQKSGLSNLDHISIDFKGLDYDPDGKYLIPMAWGVNGFLLKKSEQSTNGGDELSTLLTNSAKTGVQATLNDPVDLFFLAIRMRPSIRMWAQTGNESELKKEINEIKSRFGTIEPARKDSVFSKDRLVTQMSNGMAAEFLTKEPDKYEFVLPQERARLWVKLIGIPQGARDDLYVRRAINQLLDPEWSEFLVKENKSATVVDSLNTSKNLPEMQKASYLRKIPVSRVELFVDNESLEPTWMNIYKNLTSLKE